MSVREQEHYSSESSATAIKMSEEPLWQVLNEGTAPSPEAGVAADFALLDAVAAGTAPATLRLWQNRQCLVVSRRDSRLPGFSRAAELLGRKGWPVVVRGSGGTAVPHGAGILLVSMAFARTDWRAVAIDEGYEILCQFIIRAIRRLGVRAVCQPVPAAFCDGRYNLAVGPRKIAGTAQRWRRGHAGGVTRRAVLAHALILADGDARAMTAAVNRFYDLAGDAVSFDPESVTTLNDCLGGDPDIMPRLRDAMVATAGEDELAR